MKKDFSKIGKAEVKAIADALAPYLFGIRDQAKESNSLMRTLLDNQALLPKHLKDEFFGKPQKGDTPVKGKDYFTEAEVKEFFNLVTPKIGVDYFTKKDVEKFLMKVTPRKGVDFKDGDHGRTPKKGKDYFTKTEIKEFVSAATPVKGKHYFTVDDIAKIAVEARALITIPAAHKVMATEVREMIEGLRGKSRLKLRMSDIEGLIDTLQRLASAIGGGASGGGSGTGSGSGFQAPLSGTVDGSNKTFVFLTAPSALCVDNTKTIRKVSSDTTINWTGTTTVVLTVAPNYDLFAVA